MIFFRGKGRATSNNLGHLSQVYVTHVFVVFIIIRLFSCMIIRFNTICHMGLQKNYPVVGEKNHTHI